jgi:hypothetical protein
MAERRQPTLKRRRRYVAHWEGETLVVETLGINPDARYPESAYPASMPIGKGVRITGRIALKGLDTFEFDIETLAPELPPLRTGANESMFACPGSSPVRSISAWSSTDRLIRRRACSVSI